MVKGARCQGITLATRVDRKIQGHHHACQRTSLIVDIQAARGNATNTETRGAQDTSATASVVGAGANVWVAKNHRGGRLLRQEDA
jgi:hypothetical protein